ncbi:uncharacterized protein TRAVEDRAFT_48983 [Trametes versicolor FP-101664 SS1]|uniref:uncharacterized protein n=1 Tax=Trametes versicolor (strain FP-101664) TaxID=717944 RepID=UPI00046222C4|nr:uncharacterized protein TRAVEDRAFT_48983 [Trametes versicolor FP-101664 SS1]EIW57959.1 hypothetical protein TRAVEDRAFT_48983 [Trametes versicolor FP-101664 SS1]
MAGNSPVLDIPSPFAAEIASAERSVEQAIGAYLLGTFFSLPLYGVGLYQLYRYCRLYTKDTTYIRVIVATVMVLGTIQAVMAMHGSYHQTVTSYNQPLALLLPLWSTSFLPVVSNVIITVSQMFFARRVFLRSYHKIIVALAVILLLAQTTLGLVLTVLLFRLKAFSVNAALPYAWAYPSFFGCATFADFLLSGSIVRAMRRSRAAHPRKDSYFDIFLLYAVNTGLLTGLFNGIPFIWSLARPGDVEWIAFNSIVCKLYANTLLAVLNSRKLFVCRGMEILDGKSFGRGIIARVDHLAATERWNVPQVPDPMSGPIKVGVQMETETDGPRTGLGDGSKALEAKASVYEKSSGHAVSGVQSTSSL